MPEIEKRTVVIASVLKPVDDTRMFEKIGASLAATRRFDVHVIGCASGGKTDPHITQHSFRPFGRVSLGRLIAPWRILWTTFRLKPDLFMITTHELLYLAMLVKLIRRCKIVYDVQENYYWNILYTPAFPLLIKPFVALYVRGKETLTARFVDHFLLAEKGYDEELKFPGTRKTVLENKVRVPVSDRKIPKPLPVKGGELTLVFSGTLSETMGVFTAIDLAIKLHIMDDRIRLTLIGYCAQPAVREKIEMLIKPRPFITLITHHGPMPHRDIFREISKADFGMITHQINPSTMNSIPTKLYEYLGFKLPILLINHKPWVEFCAPYDAAVSFNQQHIDAGAIYREMMEKSFYTSEPESVYWESEEPKLLRLTNDLFSDSAS